MVRKSLIALSVVAATTFGVGASVASANSVVLCANKKTDVVRYSSNGKCRARTEKRLTLGVTGPAGATGATGATGPTGATGAAGSYATAQTVLDITSAGYTLALADAGKFVTSSVNTVITVPADASVAFAVGTRIDIGRLANYIFIQGASGVTVNGSTASQGMDSNSYQHGLLVKTAANTWVFLRFYA
ncbi:MAG: hypothetical protein ACO3V5_08935 [Ilumatobacteraceae bacterium]